MGRPKKRKTDKQQLISEWVEKGAEWCANKLYEERRAKEKINDRNEWLKSALRHEQCVNEEIYTLREVNRNMSKVLQDCGVFPTKLRVTYKESYCEKCDWYSEFEGCTAYYWDDETCVLRTFVETFSFFWYQIQDNTLSGITSALKNFMESEILKIVDEKTGEVIFEREEM